MRLEIVAAKYAKALLSLAMEKGMIEKIEEELTGTCKILADYPQLDKILRQPGIGREAKSVLLRELCERMDVSVMMREFLNLLTAKGRLGILRTVFKIYKDEAFLLTMRLKVEVKSGSPLGSDERNELRKRLSRTFNKDILLETETDKNLIGGVRIKVGHTLYDGTIRAGLNKMRKNLF